MENKKHNTLIAFIILLCFSLFSTFGFYRLNNKKMEIKLQKQYDMLTSQNTPSPTLTITNTPTPTPDDSLIKNNSNELLIKNISNYKIDLLTYTLNGAECSIPFTVKSMVSYGYLFQDKIANDNYTYNQLSEYVESHSSSKFIDTLSPNNQIISILVKNTSDTNQMILNCDVYGISASSCDYGNSEVEPTFKMSNGLYLGMTEGDMLKIMGNYDKSFYVDDKKTINRYQWYQSLDGQTITNILTCDVKNGYVKMLSVERN